MPGTIGNTASSLAGYGSATVAIADPQRLMNGTGNVYTASANDAITKIGHGGAGTTGGGQLQIGVYDITTNSLVGSTTITQQVGGTTWFEVNVGPWELVAGRQYAVAWRAVTQTVITILSASSSGVSHQTLTGTTALQSSFTNGATFNSRFPIRATVETVITSATLSDPTPSGTLATQRRATLGATSTVNSGTFYGVISSTQGDITGITAAQVYAAQYSGGGAATFSGNAAVSTTSPSLLITGLTPNTAYYYAVIQRVGTSNSNVITGSFTTAVATQTATLTLVDGNSAALNAQTLNFWTRTTLNGAAVDGSTNGLSVTSNGSGVFSFSGLTIGVGAGFITVSNPNDNTFSANYPVTFVAGD